MLFQSYSASLKLNLTYTVSIAIKMHVQQSQFFPHFRSFVLNSAIAPTPCNSNLFQFPLKVQVIGSRLYLCSLTAKRKKNLSFEGCFEIITCMTSFSAYYIPGGGTLWIYGSGSATGTMEPLAYTRVIWAEFCYPILEKTPQITPILDELFSRNWFLTVNNHPEAFNDSYLSTLSRLSHFRFNFFMFPGFLSFVKNDTLF